jgi:dipeptidyl aminopeptidase/acylaminoacyl peptidase
LLEKIRYYSDGLAVVAYFYRPRNPEGTRRPVIVFNRGSYVRTDIAPELLPMFHRLATAGFAILAPMYRGSDGGEGRDEMGGSDLNDLMNVMPLLSQLDSLDTRNVFLYGESRGGMMVFQAIRDGFDARAAATVGAFTDLGEMTSSGPGAAMAKSIWPDFDEQRNAIVYRRSAIQWSERLDLPLLLMHGSKDRDVPPTQTLLLAAELAKAQKEFGVIIFPGGNHTLRAYQSERDRQVVEFFRRYMVE